MSSSLSEARNPFSQQRPGQPHTHLFFSLFSLCILVLVLGSLLAACGGSPANSGTSSTGKVVLTELDYLNTEPANSLLNQLFSQYEKANPNVTIQRDAVPIGSVLSKASQEAASHTLPDILVIDNPDLDQFAAAGALTDLDPYMTGALSKANFLVARFRPWSTTARSMLSRRATTTWRSSIVKSSSRPRI